MQLINIIITRGPIVWFRNLFYIVKNYREDFTLLANGVDICREHVQIAERFIKKATKVHIDVTDDISKTTKVVVIGTYRGKDHVQLFTLRPGSIESLIDQLRDMARFTELEAVDASDEINATVKRSLIV